MLGPESTESGAMRVRFHVTATYSRAVLLEAGGEIANGRRCVITGTVLGPVDNRRLLIRIDLVLDSHQSAAQRPC